MLLSKQQLTEAYIYEQTGDVANAMSVLWPLRELKFTREQMEGRSLVSGAGSEDICGY